MLTAADPSSRGSSSNERVNRLLALAKPHWPVLALGTVFLFVGSAMGLLYPQAVRIFMDEALLEGNLEVVDEAALILVGVFGLQSLATALRYYLFTITGERIVTKLREELYQRILAQEIGFFDERRTGELVSRLASDTGVLQNTVSVNISMVLRNAATCLGGIGLLIYTSPRLTGLMLAVIPPVVVGAVLLGRWVRKYSRDLQDALAEAGEVAEESISGIRTVRSFAQEPLEIERYHRAVWRSFGYAQVRTRFIAWFQGVSSFAGFSALALVLGYGGRLVLEGALTVGELTAFILYTGVVAVALGTLASLYTDFMRAVGASDRVFDLMDRVPLIPLEGGGEALEPVPAYKPVEGEVQFHRVTFSYPSRPDVVVLHELDLTIRAGERVALVGPSGGGKSTIASLIPRFYDPQEGEVRLDGRDIRTLHPAWLRQHIGIVAQEPTLFSTSIRENIAYGNRQLAQDDEAIRAAAKTANAHTFIEGFPSGYDTLVGERGVQLSGGQKQRIAIARAVLRDPRILILDEATSALDAESEHLVKEALERLMQGRTTLIIAHRLSTVVGADRVLVLNQGRVVQSGRHGELMQHSDGLYRRLVEHQFVEA